MGVPHRTPILRLLPLLLIALLCGPSEARLEGASGGARVAVEAFGQALVRGETSALKSWFPREGKVRVRLIRLGGEQGAIRSGQLLVILEKFFDRGELSSFVIETFEESESLAIVSTVARIKTPRGARESIRLHLSFESTDRGWVVREFREARQSK